MTVDSLATVNKREMNVIVYWLRMNITIWYADLEYQQQYYYSNNRLKIWYCYEHGHYLTSKQDNDAMIIFLRHLVIVEYLKT